MKHNEMKLLYKEVEKLVPIFLAEFIDYVPFEKRRYLKEKIELGFSSHLVGIDLGIGAWCRDNKILFANRNIDLFKTFYLRKGYGKNKGFKLVDEENFIDNDKDYLDYIDYIIANGMKEFDYCLDILPHEVMHLIGSCGGVLGEGVTELRTRQVCKKYGIRCAPIWHSKETKLVMMLEKHLGEMALNDAAFFGDFTVIENACERIFGSEFKDVYEDLCISYRTYVIDRSPSHIEHYKKYREIDFEPIYKLIEKKEI